MPVRIFQTWSLLVLSALLLGGCTVRGPLYAEGKIAGERVAANMDSPLAQGYLQTELAKQRPALLRQLKKLEQAYPGLPGSEQLAELTSRSSVDFATLLFARRLLARPDNDHLQQLSSELASRLGSPQTQEQRRRLFEQHHMLVVPGWYWQTRAETGADLAYPRQRLDALGLESSLIETDEHGSVEKNGAIIAEAIRAARSLDKPVILVSVSKGGADTAYALGHELADEPLDHLKGWLNIGGVVGGTTFARIALSDPEFWMREEGWPRNTPLTALQSLLPESSSERLARLRMPERVTVVNYAALPFASTLHHRSNSSFAALAEYGPNDGAALSHELLIPGAPSVLEIGVDHYMRDLRVMRRVIALLMVLMDCQLSSRVNQC